MAGMRQDLGEGWQQALRRHGKHHSLQKGPQDERSTWDGDETVRSREIDHEDDCDATEWDGDRGDDKQVDIIKGL